MVDECFEPEESVQHRIPVIVHAECAVCKKQALAVTKLWSQDHDQTRPIDFKNLTWQCEVCGRMNQVTIEII